MPLEEAVTGEVSKDTTDHWGGPAVKIKQHKKARATLLHIQINTGDAIKTLTEYLATILQKEVPLHQDLVKWYPIFQVLRIVNNYIDRDVLKLQDGPKNGPIISNQNQKSKYIKSQ